MKKKIDFKEFFRRIMVSLKRRPHNICLILLIVTYLIYTFNFNNIAYTTALIGRAPMGLCTFIVMLFSLLGIVSFLNSFPPRQKPKTAMVIIFYCIQAFVLAFQIIYILKLENALIDDPSFLTKKGAEEICSSEVALFVHAGFLVLSTISVALIPVMKKLFSLVDTSVKLEENSDIKIELNE